MALLDLVSHGYAIVHGRKCLVQAFDPGTREALVLDGPPELDGSTPRRRLVRWGEYEPDGPGFPWSTLGPTALRSTIR